MIPRLRPYLDKQELMAAFKPDHDAVERFETEFARSFEAKYALAFPYGRSALWAFFKAMHIHDAEIIMPAYTCSVVAHAIVLSGNIPRFVDINLSDYNMDLDQVAEAITERTQAIVATHLFGYPLDVDRLSEMVREAENRYAHKIWVIQDCAHSFGAKWRGKLVCNVGDIALFGLNISKMITSIFGGMLTTNNPDLTQSLLDWRDRHFVHPRFIKTWQRCLYLMAVYPAFDEHLYSIVAWLQEKTPFLNSLTKAYHLDDIVHFPPDYLDQMIGIEARVGMAQLQKYPKIIHHRRDIASYYDQQLHNVHGLVLPSIVDGATYSHFPVRVAEPIPWHSAARKAGVELGHVIEYTIPEMPAYRKYAKNDFPIARQAMNSMVNLPVHYGVDKADRVRVVEVILSVARQLAIRSVEDLV